MLRVRPIDARAGMVLAMPVLHPQRHTTMLLTSGIVLDEWTIFRLHELNSPEIWIKYPGLDIVAPWVSERVNAARANVTSDVAHALDRARGGVDADLDYVRYASSIRGLLRSLNEQPKAAVFLGDLVESGQPAVRHATHVAYVSLLMGLKLDFYLERERAKLSPQVARDVTNLGVAAMLHDIGMTKLEPEVVNHWNHHQDQNNEAWREHVRLGYHMVRGVLEPTAAAAVLHHHQRYDGSGFPLRSTLSGDLVPVSGHDIHIFPRIIAAADLFDRLRHPPGGEPVGRPTVRVLRMLLESPYANWLDPVVVSALLEVCPPYPPGTIVGLSDDSEGVVVGWRPSAPCRPDVVRLGAPLNEDGVAERTRLSDHPDLHVVRVGGYDVAKDNFDVPIGGTLYEIERTLRGVPIDEETLERSEHWDLMAG